MGEQGGKGGRGVRRGAVSKPRKYLRGETRHRGRIERGNNRKSERLLQTPKGEKRVEKRNEKLEHDCALKRFCREVCALM